MDIRILKGKITQYLKIIFPLLLLVLACHEIWVFAKSLDMGLIKHEIYQIPIGLLLLVIIFIVLTASPMFLYDLIIVKKLGLQFPTKTFIKQAIIINSFSNLLGFGGLIGAALRVYFYKTKEVNRNSILRLVGHITLYFLTGISILSIIMLICFFHNPLLTEKKWLYFAIIGVALYLPVLLFISLQEKRKEHEAFLDLSSKLFLVLSSFIEWFATFFGIWTLSQILQMSINFGELFTIYVIAACAGIISMIPGGLGSFDLVFIWGAQYFGFQDEKVVVLLILYRLGYYILPFLTGTVLFIKGYWDRWNKDWDNLPNAMIGYISHFLLTVFVFISGFILLLSAALPGILERFKIAEKFFSLPIISASHQLSVATGFILLGLSRGIQYKVKPIYYSTLIVLSFAAFFSLIKGLDYEEAIFMIIVIFLLLSSKKRFYRESYVFTWGGIFFDICVILFFTFLYLAIGYTNLPVHKFHIPARLTPYMITDYADLFHSAIIGLLIATMIFIVGYYLSRSKKFPFMTSINHEAEITEHIQKFEGNVLTHLIFLHDKYIFWNSKRNVLFQYQTFADKMVVLGDPIGEKSEFPNAIEELLRTADIYGYTPVFYEISNEQLTSLHDLGYDFFKLGEEAFVDLHHFSLNGKRMKGLRATKNKFERENYVFEILQPPHSTELLNTLRDISNEWLNGRTEKGFSLGFFDKDYLNRTELGVLKDPSSTIIGFTNIMPVYDQDRTISIDLMRYKQDAPSGTMDFIFLSLFHWAKEQGYKQFNLGMAPLSNVGHSRYSFFSEKIAAQIFLHGHVFYHFQGLRQFKEKYEVTWKPKYLAFRKRSLLPITVAQVTLLIGKARGAKTVLKQR